MKDKISEADNVLSFLTWLTFQTKRDDVVGDLAEDFRLHMKFPRSRPIATTETIEGLKTHKQLLSYFESVSGEVDAVGAFKQAWLEYEGSIGKKENKQYKEKGTLFYYKAGIFKNWLMKQKHRRDAVGDFAGYCLGNNEFSIPGFYESPNLYNEYIKYYKNINATADVIEAFNLAWNEFQGLEDK